MSDRLDSLARAHDALAPTYDAVLATNPVAVWMRQRLWSHYSRAFPSRGRLLDFAAGTGADALFLAESGANVVALDISPGMIAELQRRAAERGLHVDARVSPAERLGALDAGSFDGALAGFAALNTIGDPRQLASDLARLLKPGGRLILHALNAFCLWEAANRLLHGRAPTPRQEHTWIGGELVMHRFYRPRAIWRSAFSAEFQLRDMYGLSVIAAPTWLARAPRLTPFVLQLDGWVGRALPGAGDFFVVDLERR